MKEIERVGLLKMDFLGLSTLTLIQDALAEIKRTTGTELDIDHVPLDDKKTYDLFGEGLTFGVFQFESSGMRDILRKARPQRLDDLIALNALYRPGPLRSGMVDDFIARKGGKTEIKYELPQLEPILNDTYGVIAYQEQVMRIAASLASFSLGQSDVLRKAMGKKNPAVMQAQREKFVSGAVGNGLNEKKAGKIFDLMEHFAGYGFNKSHSTTYAFLAYQTGYLKANYPWHFQAALLTIEAQNTDKVALYLGECRDRGVPVLPPDINESELRFTVTPSGVRFGLTAIKNVGEGAIESMLAVRRTARRVDPVPAPAVRGPRFAPRQQAGLRGAGEGRRAGFAGAATRAGHRADALARGAGAPDGRHRLGGRAWRARAARPRSRPGRPVRRDRRRRVRGGVDGAVTRRGALDGNRVAHRRKGSPRPLLDRATRSTRMRPTSRSSARARSPTWSPPRSRPSETRRRTGAPGRPPARSGEEVSVGGIISATRLLKTRKGDPMAVCTLEDRHGGVEIVVFPETFKTARPLVENGAMVVVRGKLERDDETVRVLATEMVGMGTVRERLAREMAITVAMPPHGRETFEALADLFAHHRGDKPVTFQLLVKDQGRQLRVRAQVSAHIRVKPTSALVQEVEKICGVGAVALR